MKLRVTLNQLCSSQGIAFFSCLHLLRQEDFWTLTKERMGKNKTVKQYKAIARQAAAEFLICLGEWDDE